MSDAVLILAIALAIPAMLMSTIAGMVLGCIYRLKVTSSSEGVDIDVESKPEDDQRQRPGRRRGKGRPGGDGS
jgi:hypothetical protein